MKLLILFIACIAAASVITHFVWPKRIIEKEYSKDTVYVRHVIHDSVTARIRVIRQKERVNIDSLWNEALDYAFEQIRSDNQDFTDNDSSKSIPDNHSLNKYPPDKFSQNNFTLGNYAFEAEADSTYKDSLITAKVIYHSPLPLHLKSYFIMDFRYKERTITEAYRYELTFFDRFRYSVNAGFGYGLINKKADIYLGAGFSFVIGR